MKKLVKEKSIDSRVAATDPYLMGEHPHLCMFLTDRRYDDGDGGGEREPGSLSVWCSDGMFRAKLNDKDTGYCCYVAGPSFGDLWAACEVACSDPEAGWKPDPNGSVKPRKK